MDSGAADWRQAVASALEWWDEVGVDVLVTEEPRDWLARPASRTTVTSAAPVAVEPTVESLPATLDDFITWRLGEGALEADWMTPRIGPSGSVEAEYVVLTDMPESTDIDALMTGPEGQMLTRMLAAIGVDRSAVHLASLAIARPLTGQIPIDAQPRLAELARHYLRLLKPRRLLLLGQAASRVVATADGSGSANALDDINPFGADTRIAACPHPRLMMERPAAKREAWKQLLFLSRGTE